MKSRTQLAAADMYSTDLDRHFFAPAVRQKRRRSEPISDWLRDWLVSGWARWRAMAAAADSA